MGSLSTNPSRGEVTGDDSICYLLQRASAAKEGSGDPFSLASVALEMAESFNLKTRLCLRRLITFDWVLLILHELI